MQGSTNRRRARLLVAILLAAAAPCANATEICGLEPSLFRDGFEESARSLARRVAKQGTTLSVQVDPEHVGQVVGGRLVSLSGTWTGSPGTGVAVNGVVAELIGDRWFAAAVPLRSIGVNALTAVATSVDDVTATQAFTMTRDDALAPDARLLTDAKPRYAPSTLSFGLEIPVGLTITRARFDFDGDGTIDDDTTVLPDVIRHRYLLPGIFAPSATLTLDDGDPQTAPIERIARTHLALVNFHEMREGLCEVFGTFRTRVAVGNVEAIQRVMFPELRERFATAWQLMLAQGHTPQHIAASLGTIADGMLGPGLAEYVLVQPIPGEPGRLRSAYLHYERGPDGVWRISGL